MPLHMDNGRRGRGEFRRPTEGGRGRRISSMVEAPANGNPLKSPPKASGAGEGLVQRDSVGGVAKAGKAGTVANHSQVIPADAGAPGELLERRGETE